MIKFKGFLAFNYREGHVAYIYKEIYIYSLAMVMTNGVPLISWDPALSDDVSL